MKTLTVYQTINYNYTLIEPKKVNKTFTFDSAEKLAEFAAIRNSGYNGNFSVEVAKYSKSNRRVCVYKNNASDFFTKYAQ
jgi:hypothetical protein